MVINDYKKLRILFGKLLREIQRIKSEGDYKAGKELVENYGVKVNNVLHKEIKTRYAKLNIAPYAAFINPDSDSCVFERKINRCESDISRRLHGTDDVLWKALFVFTSLKLSKCLECLK